MKSKNAKWWLVIAPLLFAYSAACLFITPQLCPMPEAGALTQRYAAPAVAEPLWQAVKTLASGTLGTACYAPVQLTEGFGWPYAITAVVREQAYAAYLFWLRMVCWVLLINAGWITAIDIRRMVKNKEAV